MNRKISLLLAAVMLCTLMAFPASSATVPKDQIKRYCIDYVEGSPQNFITCQMFKGTPYLNLNNIAYTLAASKTESQSKKSLTFTYGDHTVSVAGNTKTATVDGKTVQLSRKTINIGYSVWACAADVPKLFDCKVYILTKTATKDMNDYYYEGGGGDRIDVTTKKGEEFHFYNIKYNPGNTNYTSSQLTFMQGLAAPFMLHNIHQGFLDVRDKFDDETLAKYARYLRQISGVIDLGTLAKAFESNLQLGWGITGRDDLIQSIKALIRNSNGTDKNTIAYDTSRTVQLAQTGYLLGWLTAEETITYGMTAAKRAQETFSSWDDYTEYYMQGARRVIPATGVRGAEVREKYLRYLYKGNAFMEVGWNISLNERPKAA